MPYHSLLMVIRNVSKYMRPKQRKTHYKSCDHQHTLHTVSLNGSYNPALYIVMYSTLLYYKICFVNYLSQRGCLLSLHLSYLVNYPHTVTPCSLIHNLISTLPCPPPLTAKSLVMQLAMYLAQQFISNTSLWHQIIFHQDLVTGTYPVTLTVMNGSHNPQLSPHPCPFPLDSRTVPCSGVWKLCTISERLSARSSCTSILSLIHIQ